MPPGRPLLPAPGLSEPRADRASTTATTPMADALPDDPRIRYLRVADAADRSAPSATSPASTRAASSSCTGTTTTGIRPRACAAQVRALIDRRGRRLRHAAGSCTTTRCDGSRVGVPLQRGPPRVGRRERRSRTARHAWQRRPFPDVQVGEDALFVVERRRQLVLCDLRGPCRCAWRWCIRATPAAKDTGGAYWHAGAERRPCTRCSATICTSTARLPLPDDPIRGRSSPASCRPTTAAAFVPLAIQLFLRQDYPNRELIVIDDGDDPVGRPRARTTPASATAVCPARRTIGAKRNLACEQARGEIIAHWDDDDWYAPDRLALSGRADRWRARPTSPGLENRLRARDCPTAASGRRGATCTGRCSSATCTAARSSSGGTVRRRPAVSRGQPRGGRVAAAPRARTRQAPAPAREPGRLRLRPPRRNAWRECMPGRFMNPDGWVPVSRPSMFSAADLSSYERAAASM